MPDPKAWRLPEPENDTDFEVICLDLYKAYRRPRVEPERFGRNGQAQHGVDFVLDLEDGLHGFQCKCTKKLPFDEIDAEVQKIAKFPVSLKSFTVLTSAPRDATTQGDVYRLTERRRAAGLCPISVVHWETLCDLLAEYIDVLKAHYPQLAPDELDLIQGRARRLDREFPGTTLSYEAGPNSTRVTIRPGADGIPLTTTFFGTEARDRLLEGQRSGRPVTFRPGEFDVQLPDVLPRVRGATQTTLTITPSLNNTSFPVRLLVQPQSTHHQLAMFARRGRHSVESLPAALTVLEFGTHRFLVEIRPNGLPLRLVVEMVAEPDGGRRGSNFVERDAVGARVADALAAERLTATLYGGSYLGVFSPEGETILAAEVPANQSFTSDAEALKYLADLALEADWNLLVPESFTGEDVARAASLVELFRTGRRLIGRGGRVRHVLTSWEELGAIRRSMLTADTAGAQFVLPPRDVELLGQRFTMPVTRLTAARVDLSPESVDAVLAVSDPPVEIVIIIPDDVDVFEEIVTETGHGHETSQT